ncbi:MAG: cupin domain-containing protein [Bacteroidetes bacterium]|nr:cupin domain-containing protein [Bacteroidota bacterium]
MKTSKYWVDKLCLLPHPEGGYFKEIYRSAEKVCSKSLPTRFKGDRSFSTSIYFLLEKGQFSAFHRIKSDEIWHFYDGDPLTVYVIDSDGELIQYKLGLDPETNTLPQVTIPANCWFASESNGEFTLSGCTVSPGFDFEDFEMGDRDTLLSKYPNLKEIILRYTMD